MNQEFFDAKAVLKIHPHEFMSKFLSENVRPDGRNFEKMRKIMINSGSITNLDGSCLVKTGHTIFLTTIRAEIGNITSLQPNGEFILKINLLELSSPKFHIKKETDDIQHHVTYLMNNIL